MVQPWLFSSFQLLWSEVEFFSAVPNYPRQDGVWQPEPTPDWLSADPRYDDPVAELVQKGILELKLAVRDRHGLPRWTRMYLGSVYAGPMYEDEDRPHPCQGVVTLNMNTRRLSTDVGSLFDLLAANSRYELMVGSE